MARLDLTLMPPQEPRLDVQPGAIDFGNVAPNASSPRTVTIRNYGGATLSVSSIVVEDPVSPAYFTLDLNGGH